VQERRGNGNIMMKPVNLFKELYREGKVEGVSEGEQTYLNKMINLLCIHLENGTMEPDEIVLRRWGGQMRVNLIRIHCKLALVAHTCNPGYSGGRD
jgi:hypothetical protein